MASRGGGGGNLPYRPGPPQTAQLYLASAQTPSPDSTMRQLEDDLVKRTDGHMIEGFPGRKGYGKQGRHIVLRANYFSFTNTDKDKVWYKYNLVYLQQISAPKKRRLVQEIVKNDRFRNKTWATDFGNIIVTTEELDLGPRKEWTATMTIPPPPEDSAPVSNQGPVPKFVQDAKDRNKVDFKIKYEDSFSLRSILDYLNSSSVRAEYGGRVDVIQLLNIIFCKAPQSNSNVANVGQNKFYPFEGHPLMESKDLGGGLEALRGYFASVRPAVGRLLVNLNVTSGAFYKPGSLIELVRAAQINNLGQLETFLAKLKVMVNYKKDGETKPFMRKIKTIVGFVKQTNPSNPKQTRYGNAKQVKFSRTDGNKPNGQSQEITVFDYFQREHGITLQRHELPVLNVGTRTDHKYMPAELCDVAPGQPYRRILGGAQTSEMITFAARIPMKNALSISGDSTGPGNAQKLFNLNDQTNGIHAFGFGVGRQMITVPGRILSTPKVTYGNDNFHPKFGTWNCAGKKFTHPGKHGRWQVMVINIHGQEQQRNALFQQPRGDMLAPETLFQELEKQLKAYGLQMGSRVPTQTIELRDLNIHNRAGNDRTICEAFERSNQKDVRLLLVILPENDKWLYARIKLHGDTQFGIHTINSVGNKLQKPKGQGMYMGNLALKFNIKGGGASHTIANMFTGKLNNDAMLMGIDVTHPSPGSSEGAPSIASVVASIDTRLCQWPGSIRTQTGREEMVQGLEEMVLERLDLYRLKNNRLPSQIILYRDGVSEGQYDLVLKHELPAFDKAFAKRYGAENKWPKMAVLIVGKRHHTRFYPTHKDDADKNGNPQPGTIVDRGITGKVLAEFYLQAHQGLQGTARPARYVIVKNDIGLNADEIQSFTHSTCYLFNRATKAVSICPAAYYADLLCERGRAYLFSTLAENHGSESSVFDGNNAEWTGGVHQRLRDSTWYI